MSYKVLVALDGSPWSEAAGDTAVTLACRHHGEVGLTGLHVLNVTHITGHVLQDLGSLLGFEPVLVPAQVEAAFRRRGQAVLDRFVARAAAAGRSASVTLDQGAVARRLLHHAAAHDLVLAGAAGDTEAHYPGQGGGDLHRLLREARTSVLVTPATPLALTGITLGYDGSDGAQLALRESARLAAGLGLPVHAVHVLDGRRPAEQVPLEAALAYLREAGVSGTAESLGGEAHEVLPYVAQQRGHDLLALGHRGRSLLKGLLLGRVPERVVGHVELGVLVAH